ncbi:protein DpdE [Micromonospora sp. NPDC007220]|uniref:protein DpdE n=1 Tax=Micromonospora sp. NPDC007220 TaxID=3154318 RepID=UPI0033E8420F
MAIIFDSQTGRTEERSSPRSLHQRRRVAADAIVLPVGQFVEHPKIEGIGRIAERQGDQVRVEAFESVAIPVGFCCWVDVEECQAVRLLPQTRVYWQNPDTGRWRAGRIVGGGPDTYFVRLPNLDLDHQIPQVHLRVRWDRPIVSPVEVLAAGANESPYFRDARLPMLRSLVAQRAACANLPALLSAAIEIYPHQVQAALTVLSDPVQRYLLADEVGLGKTIEAGLIIRQRLLDDPTSRIVVVAPDMLRQQWNRELRDKFFTDDFLAATLKITRHETPERWKDYHGFDLVVVDEVHRLTDTADPAQSPYRELAALAHSAQRLVLISATPTISRPQAHLGMLHLLEPVLYRWDDLPRFAERFQARRVLANAVFGLDADFEPLLPSAISEISDLLPEDSAFRDLADEVLSLLTPDGDLSDEAQRPALRARVDGLRAHISETYRLHRRIIRHRRHNVLAASGDDTDALPFEVTGRERPTVLGFWASAAEPMGDLLLTWQQQVAYWLVDHDAEDQAAAYGHVLAVLASRSDGLSDDFHDAVRWRVYRDGVAAQRAGLNSQERDILAGTAVLPADRVLSSKLDEYTDGRDLDVRPLAHVLAKHGRVVVFCGGGSLAGRLVDALSSSPSTRIVAEHTHRRGAGESAAAADRWRFHGGVLIADDSVEDGVNLQDADAVVHVRLPWSPNRCEQRLGRVDRFAGAFGSSGRAAAQYVIDVGPADQSFGATWACFLVDVVKMFDDSVTALQDALENVTTTVWEFGLREGPAAMLAMSGNVAEKLRQERREIDGMDTLEAVHEGSRGRILAEEMNRMEARWGAHEKATMLYVGAEAGGLRFAVQPAEESRQVVRFARGQADPLVSPRLFALSGRTIPKAVMQGTFNRNVALRAPGTRLFRVGNPFVDTLARVAAIDDRGQACVLWRPGVRSRDMVAYFGFDFLVEADIESAQELIGALPDASRALRRQADLILPPLMQRLWLPSGEEQGVTDERLLRWLDAPYAPDRGDVNLNDQRIAGVWNYFGDVEGLAAAARRAELHARDALTRSAQLLQRAEQARDEAGRALAVRRAQAEARRKAGWLLSDTDSYLADVGVAAALIDALGQPAIRLMAVTCVVGGELGAISSGA